jgi:hypothetical protein
MLCWCGTWRQPPPVGGCRSLGCTEPRAQHESGTVALPCSSWSFAWTKKGEEKRCWRHLRNKKTKVACNPDLGPAVVLSAPRSAFLADFQPPGASKSLPGAQEQKQQKTCTKTPICAYRGLGGISIYIYIYIYIGFWCSGSSWNPTRKSGVLQGSLYLSRESLGNSILSLLSTFHWS